MVSLQRSSNTVGDSIRHCKDSPSLKNYGLEVFCECYQEARKEAALGTGLALETVPIEPFFAPEESLYSDFLPT